ncbi:Error-prone repair homolog of DNA polymerase III alpha subunit (EC 2.7.7.7) [Azospirillum doebereinerae]
MVFVTLEDETHHANIVIWSAVFDQFRRVVLGSQMMGVWGRVQKEGEVIHVVADRLIDLSGLGMELVRTDGLEAMGTPDSASVFPKSRDFK